MFKCQENPRSNGRRLDFSSPLYGQKLSSLCSNIKIHPRGKQSLGASHPLVHLANSWVQTLPGDSSVTFKYFHFHWPNKSKWTGVDPRSLGSFPVKRLVAQGQGVGWASAGRWILKTSQPHELSPSFAPKGSASFLRDDDSNLENKYDTAHEDRWCGMILYLLKTSDSFPG